MAITFTRIGAASTTSNYGPSGAARPIRGGFGHDVVMTMGEFVIGSTYATGGVALSASDVGLNDILFITFSVEPSAGTSAKGQSINIQYDYENKKVMAIGGSGTGVLEPELDNGTVLTAFTVRFLAFGHSLT